MALMSLRLQFDFTFTQQISFSYAIPLFYNLGSQKENGMTLEAMNEKGEANQIHFGLKKRIPEIPKPRAHLQARTHARSNAYTLARSHAQANETKRHPGSGQ